MTPSIRSLGMEPTAAVAAKSLQSCPTLCDPIDGSPPGSPVPGILQARTLEWVAISCSRNLYSNPSPGDSDLHQNYRKTCNEGGGECGEEQEASGSREGGPRSEEGVDHELTPSCVSPDFLHNLA